MEEKESDLARKDHWDSVFNTEIKNFEDTLKSHNCNGDVGEVWFGEHVQAKAVDYIHNNFDDKHIAILDIGCGNAAFLIAMYEEHGFDNLTGVDYSEKSVELAQMIVNKMLEERNDDIYHPHSGTEFLDTNKTFTIKQGDAFVLEDQDTYDVIHDKGTFDVVYMMKDDNNHDYVKAMYFRIKKNDTSRLIITSCNCTADELDEIFTKELYFDKVQEIKGYKTFKFGGVQGQVVSTCVYKPNVKE